MSFAPQSELHLLKQGRRSYPLQVTRQQLPMHGLPENCRGSLLAHLTDFHAGYGGTDGVLQWAAAFVASLEPDLIFLTGDFIDDHYKGAGYPLQQLLAPLHARMGVYACYGNHDHRRGLAEARSALEALSIPLLVNEAVELADGLWAAGVDDMYEGRCSLKDALHNAPSDRTLLMLSHNPSLLDSAGEEDMVIFSGHTHGAQMHIPFPSPELVCRVHLRCNQVEGWYRRGVTRLYVNRGLGVTGFPIRYHCPAEIALFELVPAAAPNAGGEAAAENAAQEASSCRQTG